VGSLAADLIMLRDAWRLRSLAGGWLATDDWHTEAVDEVAGAALPGVPVAELARACGRLGRARAMAGIGITETIEDLAALFAVLNRGDPPLHLVSSLAEGWAEEGLARHAQGRCEDPLTGLATLAYLRTRLSEVYREADQAGNSPARTYRLVVVELPGLADPWQRLTAAILLGHDLRRAFPGGDTLSQAPGPGAAIALVRACGDTPARYAGLRRILRLRCGAQIRMVPLPALLTEALRLVDELAH
jgi:hypothetical protein